MQLEGIEFDHPDRGAHLAGADTRARLAEILRCWTEPRRPAILFVLAGEAPFAGVDAEEELLTIFPGTPVIPIEPSGRGVPEPLLIFVADERGLASYAISDPRTPIGRRAGRRPNRNGTTSGSASGTQPTPPPGSPASPDRTR